MKRIKIDAEVLIPASVGPSLVIATIANALEGLPGGGVKIEKLNCKTEKD